MLYNKTKCNNYTLAMPPAQCPIDLISVLLQNEFVPWKKVFLPCGTCRVQSSLPSGAKYNTGNPGILCYCLIIWQLIIAAVL